MTTISERQRAHFYIYKKQKNAKRLYKYTKSQTLCKKQDNLCYVFIHKKQTLYVRQFFMKFLKLAFKYMQKSLHFALHDVFMYKKIDTSKRARQSALRFLYTKSLTLCV